ncbi:MAG TPA: hypothetical protein VHD62_11570 [Opitutaceae bacterium]|nr:hypothetical protein [Opitutaceae bacterium]
MPCPPDPLRKLPPLWWRFALLLLRPRLAKAVARVTLDGYLARTGWLRSVRTGEVVDAHGEPIPWATLPFVEFIAPRLRAEWRVFEYGAGASTRFYARHVREVWAVEHDDAFARRLAPLLPPNARLEVRAAGSEEYRAAIRLLGRPPEIVSIDGRDRPRCAEMAVRHVAEAGVIVFDDTERAEYREALAHIAGAGFRRLDFWGVSAGSELHRCTSVFYRPGNVLEI